MNLLNALAQALGLSLAVADERTATLTGTGIDVQDYEGVALIVLNAGAASAGTDPTLDVKLQDSADNSTFADVTGATFTQVTDVAGTAGVQLMKVNVSALKRYLRVVGTIAGTSTPTFTFGVEFVGIKKES